MGVVTEQLGAVIRSSQSQEGLWYCGNHLCWEAALADKGQLNTLSGTQTLSSSLTFMVPKTGSAAETVSFSQAKGTREGSGKMACYFHSEVF